MGHTRAMSALPETFQTDLRVRGRQHRPVRVGNPYNYLNSIGISAVLEHMYRGANIVDAAEALDVSVTVLRTWLTEEGHWPKVDEAQMLSAEGYLSLSGQLLKMAQSKFELDRAKALANHAQWLASKLDKSTYGTTEVPQSPTTVSYVFNVGDAAQIVAGAVPRKQEGGGPAPVDVPPVSFDPVGRWPEDVKAPESLGPFKEAPSAPVARAVPEDPREAIFADEWNAKEGGA